MTRIVVDLEDPTPPFEQVRREILAQIVSGDLRSGDRLPAIRRLAGDLGLAPGTVARAFKALEEAGAIVTRRGAGTTVAEGWGPHAEPQDDRRGARGARGAREVNAARGAREAHGACSSGEAAVGDGTVELKALFAAPVADALASGRSRDEVLDAVRALLRGA